MALLQWRGGLGMDKITNILERKKELEKFLSDLEDIRKEQAGKDSQGSLQLSPLAGMLEQIELNQINKLFKMMDWPT